MRPAWARRDVSGSGFTPSLFSSGVVCPAGKDNTKGKARIFGQRSTAVPAVELKIGEFQSEYKGRMKFYLSLLNDKVKLPHENDATGIFICKEKNRTIVEYFLKTSSMPIGV
jgi:hypothetical protein